MDWVNGVKNVELPNAEAEFDAVPLKAAGVYCIMNEDDEVMYVGESECFGKRWGEHLSKTKHNGMPIHVIFKFLILEYENSREKRLLLEQKYITELHPLYNRYSALSYRSTDPKINQYRRREINKIMQSKVEDCSNTFEENYNDALDEELGFLKDERGRNHD